MTAFVIRPALAGDAPAVRELLIAAFNGVVEADLVEELARDDDLSLALVAEAEGGIVGYVAYSPLSPGGGFALAPLAVAPAHQNSGIGTALVEAAHKILCERGAAFVLVLGDPDYYGRFGFSVLAASVFETPYDGPYLQALILSERGAAAAGKLTYAKAFQHLGEA